MTRTRAIPVIAADRAGEKGDEEPHSIRGCDGTSPEARRLKDFFLGGLSISTRLATPFTVRPFMYRLCRLQRGLPDCPLKADATHMSPNSS